MKNNFWDKKFIKSDDMHNFHYKFVWLTQVHMFFNQILFFTDFILQNWVKS